ncbi:hypothetical protein P7M43_07955 [Vibrio parahaemolyticus]|nr:hypothetical protein [Vibrio parahaemolyticus]
MSTTLSVSPLFNGWIQSKNGESNITINGGRAAINSGVGETATVYFPVVVYPGDSIEFSVDVYVSSVAGYVSIYETSPGSGYGNKVEIKAINNLETVKITHTVSSDNDKPKYVYVKIGYETNDVGSMTAINPKVRIIKSTIGALRTIAAGLFMINNGIVEISDKWCNSGIKSTHIEDGSIKIELEDVYVTAALSYERKSLPLFTVEHCFGQSLALNVKTRSYDQYTGIVVIDFVNSASGNKVDASSLNGERFILKAEII